MYDAFYSQVSTTQHRALELPAMPIDHYIHFVIKPRKRPEFSTFEARIIKPLLRKNLSRQLPPNLWKINWAK